jgi:hypothetical protein
LEKTVAPPEVPVVPAAVERPAAETATPFGLKYSILESSANEMEEVPADTPFHAGDRIHSELKPTAPVICT